MSTPYYEDASVTLYHGDARDLLRSASSADLVLTDPPYAIGLVYDSFADSPEYLDDLIRDTLPMMRELGTTLLTPGVANMYRYPEPTWTLAWATPAGAGSGPWGFSCWQPCLAYGPDPYLKAGLGRRPDLLIRTESAPTFLDHPCPKPLDVWRWLVLRGTTEVGQTVLDPFAGAGTTLRAAKDCGRRAVGFELSEAYCEQAASYLAQEVISFEALAL